MSETVSTAPASFWNFQFQSQMNSVRHRVEVIDDFEPRLFAEIVDAGDVDQIIEREFVAAEFRNLAEIACGNRVTSSRREIRS